MLVMENDTSVTLVCSLCGTPILRDQTFITRDNKPIHSESGECDPEEGRNPNMGTE
jgi:hypothetical protein